MHKLPEASQCGLEKFYFELFDKFDLKTQTADADLQVYILLKCLSVSQNHPSHCTYISHKTSRIWLSLPRPRPQKHISGRVSAASFVSKHWSQKSFGPQSPSLVLSIKTGDESISRAHACSKSPPDLSTLRYIPSY